MVAKLSSVRIITAASLDTSVPVMPMATPMSAFLRAGASFTPSPVMATMLLCCWREWTRRILSSGATRATTPISGSCSASSSSVRAANSAPVRARPPMPSSVPIAAAVTAWSPVIIRTSMPALWHLAMAALASARGGSTMPIMAMIVRSFDHADQIPGRVERGRVEVTSGHHHDPLTRPGHPLVLRQRGRPLLGGDLVDVTVGGPVGAGPVDEHVGGALHEAAHHVPAAAVDHAVERRHELVLGVERHLGHPGVAGTGPVEIDPTLGRQHDQRTLGRVTDQVARLVEAGIGAQRHRQKRVVQVDRQTTLVVDLPRWSRSPHR